VPDSRVSEVRSYYRSILPFYELESVSRAHLAFWTGLARERRPERILELGAGLGRITAALARVAPSVGVDISLEMLTAAQRRTGSRGPALVAADIRRPVARAAFDLILAPGDPICHATSLRERRAILKSAAAALTPSGRLVVEGLFRSRWQAPAPPRRVPHASGVLTIEETWSPGRAPDIWRGTYRYRDRRNDGDERRAEASFVARAWNRATVRRVFAGAGLAVESLWGDFDRRPFWPGARRIIIVASLQRSSGPRRAGPATPRIRAGLSARPSRLR
jgi:SAM-dependent methyltransferase